MASNDQVIKAVEQWGQEIGARLDRARSSVPSQIVVKREDLPREMPYAVEILVRDRNWVGTTVQLTKGGRYNLPSVTRSVKKTITYRTWWGRKRTITYNDTESFDTGLSVEFIGVRH